MNKPVPGAAGKKCCASGGFTLVEILIVMVLIGIVAALITANISPDGKQSLAIEAQRLSSLLEQAAEEAHDSGNTMAWSASADGYRFLRRENGQWQEITDDDLFRARKMQDNVKIAQTSVDGKIDTLLVFNSSGVNPPFELVLQNDVAGTRIAGDAMSRVTIKDDAQKP